MRSFFHRKPPANPPGRRFRRASALVAAAAAVGTALACMPATGAASAAVPTAPAAAAAAQPAAAAAPTAFTHPGVMVSLPQLQFIKGKVQANAEPWKSAYNQMLGSTYASLSRTPKPRSNVECGPYSDPNNGCTDERQDAIAAYTDALAWYISGNSAYAQKSIQLMNAWASTITTHTNSNAPLQTGWAGSVWPRAAEIIRYTYTGWSAADITKFSTMLRNVYLPEVINGSNSNGNWELTMMEAAVGISVFLNDSADYDRAITRYLNRTAAYVYLPSDGALPKTVPGSGLTTPAQIISYWQGQSTFVAGLTQETCRDFTHTGYGIASISDVAETAAIQGQDLYPQVGERLRQALGFQATYEMGAAVPSWLCGGTLTKGLGPVTEVGYNALHNRLGIAMSNTQAYTESRRPAGSNDLFVAWETLTNADNPAVIPGGSTPPTDPPTDPPTSPPPTGDPTGPITSGYAGKCVDVAAASSANGAAVQLYDCNGSDAQNWTVASDGSLRALGKCMDVAAAGTANGTLVQLYDCNGTGSQVWQKSGATLVNPQSGKCLDATGPSSANGTRLQIWTCAGGTNQQWATAG